MFSENALTQEAWTAPICFPALYALNLDRKSSRPPTWRSADWLLAVVDLLRGLIEGGRKRCLVLASASTVVNTKPIPVRRIH